MLVTDYGIVLAIFWAQIALLFVTQAIHMRSEQVDEYNSMIVGFIFVVLSFRVLTIPEQRGWGSLVVIVGAIALGLVFSDPNARADYMNVTLKWPQGSIHLGLLAIVAIMLIAESKIRLQTARPGYPCGWHRRPLPRIHFCSGLHRLSTARSGF